MRKEKKMDGLTLDFRIKLAVGLVCAVSFLVGARLGKAKGRKVLARVYNGK